MKRLAAFTLALVLALTLAACDGNTIDEFFGNFGESESADSPSPNVPSQIPSQNSSNSEGNTTDTSALPPASVNTGILIEYDTNALMYIYDVRITVDDSILGTQAQGEKKFYELTLAEGLHDIVFSEFGDNTNTKAESITVSEGEYYYIFIKARSSGIEIEKQDIMTIDEVRTFLEEFAPTVSPSPDAPSQTPSPESATPDSQDENETETSPSTAYIYGGPTYQIVDVQDIGSSDMYWVLTDKLDYSTDEYRDIVKAIITDVVYNTNTDVLDIAVVTEEDIIELETNMNSPEEYGQEWYESTLTAEETDWVAWYTGGFDYYTNERSDDESAFTISWFIADYTERDDESIEFWKPDISQ